MRFDGIGMKFASRALAAAGLAGVLAGCDQMADMERGARYAAKWTCSCVFVSGRSEEACAADLMGGADRLPRKVDHGGRSVEAGLPLLTGRAEYEEGRGCSLQ